MPPTLSPSRQRDHCEFFNCPDEQPRRFRLAGRNQLVERILADIGARNVANRIFANFAYSFPPVLQDAAERTIARPISDKPFSIAQLGIVGVDLNGRQ
jgi:hypothetical protein